MSTVIVMPARAVADALAGLLLVAAARGSLVDEVDALGDTGAPAGRAGAGPLLHPPTKTLTDASSATTARTARTLVAWSCGGSGRGLTDRGRSRREVVHRRVLSLRARMFLRTVIALPPRVRPAERRALHKPSRMPPETNTNAAHCANGQWSEIDRRDFRRDTTRCRGTRGLGGTAQPKHLALRRQRETLPWTHPARRSPRFGRTRRYSTTRRPYRARQTATTAAGDGISRRLDITADGQP